MSAILSPCGTYRYRLTRYLPSLLRWVRPVTFIMLNPSTADATADDPTIRRCLAFADRWGGTELRVVNLFALRSTDPKALYKHADPIGPENAEHLREAAVGASILVAAWGTHASKVYPEWTRQVTEWLAPLGLEALKINGDGSPAHPLYQPAAAERVRFGGGS